jgi:hypothetical protein
VTCARTHGVCIADGYRGDDSIRFALSAGYRTESIPPPLRLDAKFGAYRFEAATTDDGAIRIFRSLQMNCAELPPEKYAYMVYFLKKIYGSDHLKIVLTKEAAR